jgi:L-seryl-tRNA(Ser) seleniumtransferase
LLGGPQAGFIVGKGNLIRILSRHPLNRVFRPGKTIYSLMEEALIARLNRDAQPPVKAMLELSMDELRARGETLLGDLPPGAARMVDSTVTSGGGSAPDEAFPSLSLALQSDRKANELLRALREMDPPIIATVENDRVQLNLATILPEELQMVAKALLLLIGANP